MSKKKKKKDKNSSNSSEINIGNPNENEEEDDQAQEARPLMQDMIGEAEEPEENLLSPSNSEGLLDELINDDDLIGVDGDVVEEGCLKSQEFLLNALKHEMESGETEIEQEEESEPDSGMNDCLETGGLNCEEHEESQVLSADQSHVEEDSLPGDDAKTVEMSLFGQGQDSDFDSGVVSSVQPGDLQENEFDMDKTQVDFINPAQQEMQHALADTLLTESEKEKGGETMEQEKDQEHKTTQSYHPAQNNLTTADQIEHQIKRLEWECELICNLCNKVSISLGQNPVLIRDDQGCVKIDRVSLKQILPDLDIQRSEFSLDRKCMADLLMSLGEQRRDLIMVGNELGNAFADGRMFDDSGLTDELMVIEPSLEKLNIEIYYRNQVKYRQEGEERERLRSCRTFLLKEAREICQYFTDEEVVKMEAMDDGSQKLCLSNEAEQTVMMDGHSLIGDVPSVDDQYSSRLEILKKQCSFLELFINEIGNRNNCGPIIAVGEDMSVSVDQEAKAFLADKRKSNISVSPSYQRDSKLKIQAVSRGADPDKPMEFYEAHTSHMNADQFPNFSGETTIVNAEPVSDEPADSVTQEPEVLTENERRRKEYMAQFEEEDEQDEVTQVVTRDFPNFVLAASVFFFLLSLGYAIFS